MSGCQKEQDHRDSRKCRRSQADRRTPEQHRHKNPPASMNNNGRTGYRGNPRQKQPQPRFIGLQLGAGPVRKGWFGRPFRQSIVEDYRNESQSHRPEKVMFFEFGD
jgi:hypothetical protein